MVTASRSSSRGLANSCSTRPAQSGSYTYRKRITVAAGATAPAGYSASLTFDHAALVSASLSRADGNDIRIAYWGGAGWTELDRVLGETSSWNSASTQLWFQTQAAVTAGEADVDYYVYYGHPSATSPPASKANVYLAYDNFTGATLDATPSGWTVQTGGPWHAVDSGGNRILRRKASGAQRAVSTSGGTASARRMCTCRPRCG